MDLLSKCILYMQCRDIHVSEDTTTIVTSTMSNTDEGEVHEWKWMLFTACLWFVVVPLSLLFFYGIWVLVHIIINLYRRHRRHF